MVVVRAPSPLTPPPRTLLWQREQAVARARQFCPGCTGVCVDAVRAATCSPALTRSRVRKLADWCCSAAWSRWGAAQAYAWQEIVMGWWTMTHEMNAVARAVGASPPLLPPPPITTQRRLHCGPEAPNPCRPCASRARPPLPLWPLLRAVR